MPQKLSPRMPSHSATATLKMAYLIVEEEHMSTSCKHQSIGGTTHAVFQIFFHFRDTHFIGNTALKYGGGLYFNSITTTGAFCSGGNIIFDNCTFYNNSVFSREGGAAAHITTYKVPGYIQHGVPQLQTAFKRCNFSHSNPHRFIMHPLEQSSSMRWTVWNF